MKPSSSENTVARSDPEQVEADGEDAEVPGHLPGLGGDEERDEDAGDDVDLVGGAHEDEGDDGKVEARVEGDEDQGAWNEKNRAEPPFVGGQNATIGLLQSEVGK